MLTYTQIHENFAYHSAKLQTVQTDLQKHTPRIAVATLS